MILWQILLQLTVYNKCLQTNTNAIFAYEVTDELTVTILDAAT